MRAVVNAEVIALFSVYVLCWCFGHGVATGGALDSGTNFQQPGSTGSPLPKNTAFTSRLTDGLAQAVAHESSKLSSLRFYLSSSKSYSIYSRKKNKIIIVEFMTERQTDRH